MIFFSVGSQWYKYTYLSRYERLINVLTCYNKQGAKVGSSKYTSFGLPVIFLTIG